MKRYFLIWALLIASIAASATELKDKMLSIKAISSVTELQSNDFKEKYIVKFNHPVDYKDPSAGRFDQRVFVCHRGFDRPTVLVTEGYGADYAARESYCDELSKLFDLNIILCEYRYFLESTPDPCDWKYLTVENSLCDLHEVVTAFKNIYPEKWISTGISKGGQTCMVYRAYFPDDVDISVPYVAPLNKKMEDGRHEPFISKKVATPAMRKEVLDYQTGLFQRKAEILPEFERRCNDNGYTFRLPVADIFDYWILEFAFAYWQWGAKITDFPSAESASPKELVDAMFSFNDPSYFQSETYYKSFFVQAARELGYYGYDIRPFKKYMSVKSTRNYMLNLMLPDYLSDIKFDRTISRHTYDFLKKNDPKILYIYGGYDPWSASGVCQWLDTGKKQNIKIFIQPGGSHRTRIGTMPEDKKSEIMATLSAWLAE